MTCEWCFLDARCERFRVATRRGLVFEAALCSACREHARSDGWRVNPCPPPLSNLARTALSGAAGHGVLGAAMQRVKGVE